MNTIIVMIKKIEIFEKMNDFFDQEKLFVVFLKPLAEITNQHKLMNIIQ